MTVARTVLDSGVTVVTEQVPYLRSATIGVWSEAGSRAEAPPDNGIAHFIEHMLFKGTPRRKALDISREIESVGGTMNACTEREYVFFFAKVLAKDFPLAVDILSDIYKEGDEVMVRVLEIDRDGKIRLSHKEFEKEGENPNLEGEAPQGEREGRPDREREPRGDRGRGQEGERGGRRRR